MWVVRRVGKSGDDLGIDRTVMWCSVRRSVVYFTAYEYEYACALGKKAFCARLSHQRE